ncbi:hypothetical protein J4G37_06835 [Microvirga sp. 3-52]|nr:hypothetical protein [Microvirga sp. 3-52]
MDPTRSNFWSENFVMHLQLDFKRPQWSSSRSMRFMRGCCVMRDLEPSPDPGPAPWSPVASLARAGTAGQVPFHCVSA